MNASLDLALIGTCRIGALVDGQGELACSMAGLVDAAPPLSRRRGRAW